MPGRSPSLTSQTMWPAGSISRTKACWLPLISVLPFFNRTASQTDGAPVVYHRCSMHGLLFDGAAKAFMIRVLMDAYFTGAHSHTQHMTLDRLFAALVLILTHASVVSATPGPAYPLKTGPTGRYLVDQESKPFLIAGDSPQSLMVNLTEADARLFLSNRHSHGFNAVWINLLCRKGTGGREDGSTYDGLFPFATPDNLSAPNEAYFARCDRMIELAAEHGLLVILDPCETIDHLKVMVQNGPQKCREFGRYLGKRYRRFDNILWMSGNDFNDWNDATNDAAVLAVAQGIKDADPRHLQTIELSTPLSGSLDDARWAPLLGLSASYTYFPTYAQVLKDYNRPSALPVFMVEADYEFERDSTPAILRRQEYWADLSGATGQLYGNLYTWTFTTGWKQKLDTPGAIQMAFLQALLGPRAWYALIPDQKHEVVTAGYGTSDTTATEGNKFIMTSDFVTAARTADGTLVLAYLPTRRTLTVDMTKLSRPATARWYDPSRGTYAAIDGSPVANTGSHAFTPPGNNADGDGDWVLVLETNPPVEHSNRAR